MNSLHSGLLGKYILQGQLGEGSAGEVWKAFDERLHRYVAIKFLHASLQDDPEFVARFVREARAVASLRHPNIVQVYDFETPAPGTGQLQAYMVMSYIAGPTLADYLSTISRVQKFPSAMEMVSLFCSLGEAIDYAHQNGVCHRDIKPTNILLDQCHTGRNGMGEPILTDFGLAKMLGPTKLTMTGTIMGTPFYLSPEQALGRPASAASDIYSLSVVLYEMVTGRPPFLGENALEIIHQHASTPPTPPEYFNPAVSPELAAVILRGLAKDPDERFPNALALASALAAALNIHLPASQRELISASDIRQPTAFLSNSHELPASSDQSPELINHMLATFSPATRNDQVAHPTLDVPAIPSPMLTVRGKLRGMLAHLVRQLPAKRTLARLSPAPGHLSVLRRRRGVSVALTACLLAVLLGSAVVAFSYFRTGTSSMVVGQAFFTSSGAAIGADNLGINDVFQVRLSNIPQPIAGTHYYAWLLPDLIQTEANPRALGALVINGGVATLPAPYTDPQHENLIAQFSRFLVTEEPMQPPPQSPSLDTHLWRYYAVIPQNPPSMDCQGMLNQLSALCHLRHLLSGDPELAQVHMKGGLNYWFLNNVIGVQHWATEVVTHTDPTDVRHKVVDVLYMLDGRGCVAQDILHATPDPQNVPDDSNLSTTAAIPLLDCSLTPDIPSYLGHIHNHLNAMVHAPGVSSDLVALGTQISTELNTMNEWLMELQIDGRQLIALNNVQLMQTQGVDLRNQLEALATNVLSGSTDDKTGLLLKGAASISGQIQQLATMDVMSYTTH